MLLIKDFIKFDIQEVKLDELDHPLWDMIYKRFGCNNQQLIIKMNTIFMSYEFYILVQLILDGVIYSDIDEYMMTNVSFSGNTSPDVATPQSKNSKKSSYKKKNTV